MIRPVRVDFTEIIGKPILFPGVSQEVNAIRLRLQAKSFGPSSFITPDDVEMFERVHAGLQCEDVEWLLISRGMNRERSENGTIVADSSDETPFREQYAQWVRLMTAPQSASPVTDQLVGAGNQAR